MGFRHCSVCGGRIGYGAPPGRTICRSCGNNIQFDDPRHEHYEPGKGDPVVLPPGRHPGCKDRHGRELDCLGCELPCKVRVLASAADLGVDLWSKADGIENEEHCRE